MKILVVALAAVLALAGVALAGESQTEPVISYLSWHKFTHTLYVSGPAGTHAIGDGQRSSVAPDGRMVSSSVIGSDSGALLLFDTAGKLLHSFFTDRRTVTPLSWSPDSRYLAVQLGPRNSTSGTSIIADAGLAVIDTKTMTTKTISSGVITGASFAPSGSGPDALVFGLETAAGQGQNPALNLYTLELGNGVSELTLDGDRSHPLWTAQGIVYDKVSYPSSGASPTYQLWILNNAGHSTQLTPNSSPVAIIPRAASANGNRLVADYAEAKGQKALVLQISPRKIRVLVNVATAGISRNGQTLLLDVGENADLDLPPHNGAIETTPFSGGRTTRLTTGDAPAWNG